MSDSPPLVAIPHDAALVPHMQHEPPAALMPAAYHPARDAHDRFCAVLDMAEEKLAKADLPAAAALAQLAARYAFPANVGLFGSQRLERLLVAIGKQIKPAPSLDSAAGARANGDARRHVVHVMTYAKPIGGDSRYAWRWMQIDTASRHSAVITSQSEIAAHYELPSVLTEATSASGGLVHALKSPTSRPIDQAREMRALCQDADVVVLHLYPYDIVPMLALAAGCERAKVVLLAHSDHTFWIGAGVANLIVDVRDQPYSFMEHRRGLDPRRSALLPIPVTEPTQAMDRLDAKKALGYSADTVVLLTIASPFKYSAPGETGLLDLAESVVCEYPNVVLLAVGPSDEGAWHAAKVASGGRIQPMGRRWDNDVLYAAADIYLDSVPFSSSTSLLEAGLHGAPLLGYRSADPNMALLGPGAPGFKDMMAVSTDPDDYRSHLRHWIEDAPLRRELGLRTQAQIRDLHAGDGWRRALNQVYTDLATTTEHGCLGHHGDTFAPSTLDLALSRLFGQVATGTETRGMVGHCISPLPYFTRCALTWRLFELGFDLNPLNLLPPPLDTWVRQARRALTRP